MSTRARHIPWFSPNASPLNVSFFGHYRPISTMEQIFATGWRGWYTPITVADKVNAWPESRCGIWYNTRDQEILQMFNDYAKLRKTIGNVIFLPLLGKQPAKPQPFIWRPVGALVLP